MQKYHFDRKKAIPNNRLKKERELRSWTHKDVADMLNLSDSHMVSRWERGIYFPQPYYRRELSRIFGKSLEELGLIKSETGENELTPVFLEGDKQESLRGNLPETLTSFIGRDQDVATVGNLLQNPRVRLVTLIGPGGVGKTRLCVEIAKEIAHFFRDGLCFVSLATISDPSFIMSMIAEELGIHGSREMSSGEQVQSVLHQKTCLLLLDNFEQVVEGSVYIHELLVACPHIKVLVTSRILLHLPEEHVYSVLPLALPDLIQLPEAESLMCYASIALFVHRAQAVLSTFQITQSNAPVMAEICVRLDGLPLAIELAAARIKLFPLRALLARLSERLNILTSDLRTIPERQRTLYNTITWSYDLLTTEEQWFFRQISVFVGGGTLEAMTAVCEDNRRPSIDVLSILSSLVDKSLVQQVEQEGDEPRFVLLESIQEYGQYCLRTYKEAQGRQKRHAMYYHVLVEKAGTYLKGDGQLKWLDVLEREKENLRAALDWFIVQWETELALRFCESFGKFCGLRGYWTEEWRWLMMVLALPATSDSTAIRARVLRRAGHLAYRLRKFADAYTLQAESVALSRELGDKQNLAGALSGLGWVLYRKDDLNTARQLLEESITVAREAGDKWVLANTLESMGRFLHYQGDNYQACLLLEQSVTLARELMDKESLARILKTQAIVEIAQGNVARAKVLAQESLVLAQEMGTKPLVALVTDSLGEIAMFQGQYEQAVEIFETRIQQAHDLGDRSTVASKQLLLGKISLLQGKLLQTEMLVNASTGFFRSQHDNPNVAKALSVLGDLRCVQGDFVLATAIYKEALLLAKKIENKKYIGEVLFGLGKIALENGQFERATCLLGATESYLKPHLDMHAKQRENYQQIKACLRSHLGETDFAAVWANGQEIKLEQLLASLETAAFL